MSHVLLPSPSPSPRASSPELRLEETPEGSVLHLKGPLPPGWCVNLCTGLAQLHVDVRRGVATTDGTGRWEARFELASRGRPPLDELEALVLTDRSVSIARLPAIVLRAWSLGRDGTGAMLLELEGPDRTGLLAAVLKRLAYFSLFPRRLEIEGDAQEGVRDRLWLYEGGGRIPSPDCERSLRQHLPLITRSRD